MLQVELGQPRAVVLGMTIEEAGDVLGYLTTKHGGHREKTNAETVREIKAAVERGELRSG